MLKTPAQSRSLPLPAKRQPPLPPRQPGLRQLRTLASGKASGVHDSPSNASRAQQAATLLRPADLEQLQADSKLLVFNRQELRPRVFCVNQVTQNTFWRLALLPGCTMCRSGAVFAGFRRCCLSAGSLECKSFTSCVEAHGRSVMCQPGDGDSRVLRINEEGRRG